MNIKILLLAISALVPFRSSAQQSEIILPIQNLFDGMRSGDAEQIASAFTSNATLETYLSSGNGTEVESSTAADFIKAASQPHDVIWNEVIWSYDVRRDGPLATVWTDYTFYIGNQLSHCGVNAFQLIHEGSAWKITRIADTRRNENCRELEDDSDPELVWKEEIDQQIWTPFKKAYRNFDAILMNDIHTDDFIRANKWRITIGDEYKKQNAKRYQEARDRGDKRSIEFFFDSRKATENHAVESGFYKVHSNRQGSVKYFYGYFNVLHRKENNTWKIAYDWDTDAINGMKINEEWLRGSRQ